MWQWLSKLPLGLEYIVFSVSKIPLDLESRLHILLLIKNLEK